jgi:hypothetical protein
MATAEDIAMVVAAVLQKLEEQKVFNGGGQSKGKRLLDERNFRRIDKYDGNEKGWKDWCFQFKAAMRATDKFAVNVMEYVEKEKEDMTAEELDVHFTGDDNPEMDRLGSELYDLLCSLVTGEAMTIVRGEIIMNGFLAWRKIFKR